MSDDTTRKFPPRTPAQWEARYHGEDLPWDTGRVDVHLELLVREGVITPCRVLEVGCGTGADSVWLASSGFDVTGVDVSPTAIARARERAHDAGLEVNFEQGSFPENPEPFELVYDCGCLHTMHTNEERAAFAANVARCLRPEGRWVSILGSTDGPPRDHGPPRLSAVELTTAVEPDFELLSLVSDDYDADLPSPARAWVMLARKRDA